MKKKVLAALLAGIMVIGTTGCGKTDQGTGKEALSSTVAPTAAATEAVTEAAAAENEVETDVEAEDSYTIGISQFAEHGSLDNCREGFIQGLSEAGLVEGENLTILFDNAQADMTTASTIADSYVSQNVDLVCAIATPSAMSAYNSCMNTEIPVIYTAVSEPAGAGLAAEDGTPVGNITGTSDALPVTEQLEMIRTLLPEAKKIGIIYTTSEANSVSTIAEYKASAGEYGFEIIDTGINTIADVSMAAADLAGRVDCITNLTDNTVVSALQTVIDAASAQNIPVFGSEIEQVKDGCVAAMGLDYIQLGKQTGAMAAKVLLGETEASEMPYEVITEASLYVNTAAAERISMELDADYINGAAEVFTEMEE